MSLQLVFTPEDGAVRYLFTPVDGAVRYPGVPAGGGFDGNPANLDNILLYLNGANQGGITGGDASNVTAYTDDSGRPWTRFAGTIRMDLTPDAFTFSGSQNFTTPMPTSDPMHIAMVAELRGSIMGRVRNTFAASDRGIVDFGTQNSPTLDGIFLNTFGFLANGIVDADEDFSTFGDGSLSRIDNATEIVDFCLVFDGAGGATVYLRDAVTSETGIYTPRGDTSGTNRNQVTLAAANLGTAALTGDVFQLVVTSDTITADEYAAFRTWSP